MAGHGLPRCAWPPRTYRGEWRAGFHICLTSSSCAAARTQAGSRDNPGMEIMLNGESRALATGCTLAGLLVDAGLAQRRVAVEVNGEIVPRARHEAHVLADGDRVEIVHALGGG